MIHGEDIFVLSSGGLYLYSIADNEIETLSSLNGLRNDPISCIGIFNDDLAIGYQNGMIDLLYADGSISRLDDIFKSGFENKVINEIRTVGNYVLISAGFGVVVFDKISGKVLDSFFQFDDLGSVFTVHSAFYHNNELFLSTQRGLLTAKYDGTINLYDFKNWSLNNSYSDILSVELVQEDLLMAVNLDGLYKYSGNNSWSNIGLIGEQIVSVYSTPTKFLVAGSSGFYEYANSSFSVHTPPEGVEPGKFFLGESYSVYASQNKGILLSRGAVSEYIRPQGPFLSDIVAIKEFSNSITITSFARKSTEVNRDGWSVFKENRWTDYNNFEDVQWSQYENIVAVADLQRGKYLFSSFGRGVFQFEEDNNSINEVFSPDGLSLDSVALLSFKNGKIWMCTSEDNPEVYSGDLAGNWKTLNTDTLLIGKSVIDIRIVNDYLIFLVNGGLTRELLIARVENDRLAERYTSFELPGIPNCIDTDSEGNVWIGTSRGVVFISYYYKYGDISIHRPLIGGVPLFRSESVNTIQVNPGNELWIGTKDGLWLFDDKIENQLAHINTENSPLISNQIMDTGIIPGSGELFVLTPGGLQSFRAGSTSPRPDYSQVKIFPNPVRPSFSGFVSIEGLKENSLVKIIGISGHLIWEGYSSGGTAVWDLLDMQQNEVETGVYLVYAKSDSGDDVLKGKILVVK